MDINLRLYVKVRVMKSSSLKGSLGVKENEVMCYETLDEELNRNMEMSRH